MILGLKLNVKKTFFSSKCLLGSYCTETFNFWFLFSLYFSHEHELFSVQFLFLPVRIWPHRLFQGDILSGVNMAEDGTSCRHFSRLGFCAYASKCKFLHQVPPGAAEQKCGSDWRVGEDEFFSPEQSEARRIAWLRSKVVISLCFCSLGHWQNQTAQETSEILKSVAAENRGKEKLERARLWKIASTTDFSQDSSGYLLIED